MINVLNQTINTEKNTIFRNRFCFSLHVGLSFLEHHSGEAEVPERVGGGEHTLGPQ